MLNTDKLSHEYLVARCAGSLHMHAHVSLLCMRKGVASVTALSSYHRVVIHDSALLCGSPVVTFFCARVLLHVT
jgi:hypothetical protein